MAGSHVDAQTITDIGLDVFEAIVTLEYTGRRPSRSAIELAAHQDRGVVDNALDDMTRTGLLTVTDDSGEPVYLPARRDWSTKPDQAAGHPMK
jgi:hypothetical protein